MGNEVNLNPEHIFSILDKADGKADQKINASIWNQFAQICGGNKIQSEISQSDAMRSITTYISRATEATKKKIAEFVNKKSKDLEKNQTQNPQTNKPRLEVQPEQADRTRVAQSKPKLVPNSYNPIDGPITSKTLVSDPKTPINETLLLQAFDNVLNKILNGKNSVLKGQAAAYLKAAKEKNVNPFILMGITMHESANGTSNLAKNKNNVGGLLGKNGGITYKSVPDSISAAGNVVKNNYNNGRQTLEDLAMKGNYVCENNAGRKKWLGSVVNFAEKIRQEYNRLLKTA